MSIKLDVQKISQALDVPEDGLFRDWILAALKGQRKEAEVTLRIVDLIEMTQLNFRYRGKKQSTNVLSFPLEADPLVGDIALRAPVVAAEAKTQKKDVGAHWAHLTIHGVLHLLGYDHTAPAEADAMESLEIRILKDLGFPNPYQITR